MGLIVHEEGCDAIRCNCNRPINLKEMIIQLEEKRTEKQDIVYTDISQIQV